jgi:serine/threonine protein kinase
LIGTVLRVRYELSQSLGEHPLFDVYVAKDRLQTKDVCVRVIKPPYSAEPEFLERLTSVVQSVSSVIHHNLERLYTVDGDDRAVFLVSELSRGTSLRERLRKLGSLSVPVSVGTAVVVCDAVQALHDARFAHGDIGAHNVVIAADGEAKVQLGAIWQAYSFSQTAGQAVLPQMAAYMAPEISRGSMPSPRSDVYSIGVLLYEMLAGRLPYHADSVAALSQKHANDAVPNVRMLNPSVPVVLAEIVKKAMAKDPGLRYASAGDMVADLRVLQNALKHGKTLTWPIREEAIPDEAPPVAPRMSAVRGGAQDSVSDMANAKGKGGKGAKAKKQPRQKEEDFSDVPIWLRYLIVVFASVVGVMVVGYLVYNMNKPKTIKVPDVRRLTVSEATSRLQALGLDVYISRRVTSDTIPAEHVVSSWPQPGEMSKERSKVGIVVSLGSDFVQVPKITGETLARAKEILATVSLEVSDVIEEVETNDHKPGTIIGQDPKAGTKILRSSAIKLKVAKKKEENKDANKKYVYEIDLPVTGTTLPVVVRIDMEDSRGKRQVYRQNHEPEDNISLHVEGFGPRIKLIVYYDDQQVAEKVVTAEEAIGGE